MAKVSRQYLIDQTSDLLGYVNGLITSNTSESITPGKLRFVLTRVTRLQKLLLDSYIPNE